MPETAQLTDRLDPLDVLREPPGLRTAMQAPAK